VDDLKEKVGVLLEKEFTENERKEIRNRIKEKYNWEMIAEKTIEVYRKALGRRARSGSQKSEVGGRSA